MKHHWKLTCLFAFSSSVAESTPVGVDSDGVIDKLSLPRQVEVDVELNPGMEFEDEDITLKDANAKTRKILQLRMRCLAARLYPEKGASAGSICSLCT